MCIGNAVPHPAQSTFDNGLYSAVTIIVHDAVITEDIDCSDVMLYVWPCPTTAVHSDACSAHLTRQQHPKWHVWWLRLQQICEIHRCHDPQGHQHTGDGRRNEL